MSTFTDKPSRLNKKEKIEYKKIKDGKYKDLKFKGIWNEEIFNNVKKEIKHSDFYNRVKRYKIEDVDLAYENAIARIIMNKGKISKDEIKDIIHNFDMIRFEERDEIEIGLDWEDFLNDMKNDLSTIERIVFQEYPNIDFSVFSLEQLINIGRDLIKANLNWNTTDYIQAFEDKLNEHYNTTLEGAIYIKDFTGDKLIVWLPSGKLIDLFKPIPITSKYKDIEERFEDVKFPLIKLIS